MGETKTQHKQYWIVCDFLFKLLAKSKNSYLIVSFRCYLLDNSVSSIKMFLVEMLQILNSHM